MNTEEGFILASLKELVKLWGSGSQSSYHLECRNGLAWFQFGSILGSPGFEHFVPKAPVKDTYKKKSPSRIQKDRARAAAYRQAKASADTADVDRSQPAEPLTGSPVSSPLSAVPASTPSSPPPLLAAPATSPPPHSPVSADPAAKQVQIVAAETAAELSVATTEQQQPSVASVDGKFASTVPESSAGQVSQSSNQPVQIESEIIVHATAVIDDSRNETITPSEIKSIEKIIFRENHLRLNITRIQIGEQYSRSFRNNRFKHSVEYLILVKTEKLWESPRQYIWKHLGQLEWKQENGARMIFNRIHVK